MQVVRRRDNVPASYSLNSVAGWSTHRGVALHTSRRGRGHIAALQSTHHVVKVE